MEYKKELESVKNIVLLVFIALVSATLFGCQNEAETVKTEALKSETERTGSEQLLSKSEISKVEMSKTKGIDPVVYEETDVLRRFNELFSSAAREPGTANVTDPEFYLKLTDEEGNIQRLHVWLGNEGEQSMLMNPIDTHSIYTLAPDMTAKFIGLIEK